MFLLIYLIYGWPFGPQDLLIGLIFMFFVMELTHRALSVPDCNTGILSQNMTVCRRGDKARWNVELTL